MAWSPGRVDVKNIGWQCQHDMAGTPPKESCPNEVEDAPPGENSVEAFERRWDEIEYLMRKPFCCK